MQRLLAGKPLRFSDGLDIVTLAHEADLKRNKLTHKHKDLKDLFYAEVKARDSVPDSEVRLRDEITPERQVKTLREERDDYRAASETFARGINVLTVENDNLHKKINKRNSSSIRSLPSRR